MNKTGIRAAIALALLSALPAQAQDGSNDGIAKIVFFRAKPGMEKQLEDGLKKHNAWHKEHGGKWAWYTWTTETGDDTGAFAAGTFGHNWADFDKLDVDGDADFADVAKNILPNVAEGAKWQYYALLANVSLPPAKVPAMNEVIIFHLNYGKNGEFMSLLSQFHEAIKKTKWPVNYTWYELVNGGDGPLFVLVLPHDTYGDMKGPAKSFPEMLTDAVGPHESGVLLERLNKAVKGETSELIHNRLDLSYVPEAKK